MYWKCRYTWYTSDTCAKKLDTKRRGVRVLERVTLEESLYVVSIRIRERPL